MEHVSVSLILSLVFSVYFFFFFYKLIDLYVWRCLMKNNDFKESAPIFTKRLIDRRVEINSTVRFSCQVYGLPVPAIMWYKDGEPLNFAGMLWSRLYD